MKNLIAEFKDFINRGNVLDLAIAVVLATFFAPVVTAVVDGVIMNIIAAIFGQPDFHDIHIKLRGEGPDATYIEIGDVITAAVNFALVAFACFLIVKAYNQMKAPEEAEEAGPSEIDLLTQIRDELRAR